LGFLRGGNKMSWNDIEDPRISRTNRNGYDAGLPRIRDWEREMEREMEEEQEEDEE
jgi:hypothetical protein